jgi:Ca-activated chloride channel family protein
VRFLALLISIMMMQKASAGVLDWNLWQADSKLKEEKYADAVKDYLKIQAQDPANSRLNYNLGIGLYRLGAFDNAAFNFQQAAEKSNSAVLKEKSLYNLGNSLFKKEDYETAIKAYEAALKIDSEDEDTKFNLALAKKKLEQQQNQDQNKDDQNKDQKNKDQQNKDNKDDQDKKDQDKQNQDQQNKDQQDQNQDQKQDQNKDKNKNDQQKESEPKEKKGDLDEQEIKMLLMQVKEGTPKGKSLGVKSKSPSDPKAKKKPW